jgi:hypothetical protein
MTPHEPTPAEIKAATAAIRATWDDATEQSRRVGGCQRQEWQVPGRQRAECVIDRRSDDD